MPLMAGACCNALRGARAAAEVNCVCMRSGCTPRSIGETKGWRKEKGFRPWTCEASRILRNSMFVQEDATAHMEEQLSEAVGRWMG